MGPPSRQLEISLLSRDKDSQFPLGKAGKGSFCGGKGVPTRFRKENCGGITVLGGYLEKRDTNQVRGL